MDNSLVKNLEGFGLTSKEAQVYLILVRLGPSTGNDVAKASGIKRPSAYVVLESLKEKGLIGISDDTSVRRFTAISPESLLQNAKEKVREQEKITKSIESILPDLKSLSKETRQEPAIKVLRGKDGLIEIYNSIFSSKSDELRVFGDLGSISQSLPDFSKKNKERQKRKTKMFGIIPETKETKEQKSLLAKAGDEIVFVPEDKLKFSANFVVLKDKVAITSAKDKLGVIIENQEIADMFKANFNLAWKEAKK